MKKLVRQALNLIIATSALGFGLAVGAPAQDPGGRHVPAAAATPVRERYKPSGKDHVNANSQALPGS